MTVWKVLRTIWTVISVPFLVIFGLNVERIAQAHKLDQLLPDPAAASGLLGLAQVPWLVALSIFVTGTVVGLWADAVLRRVFSKKIDTEADRLSTLGYTMRNLANRAEDLVHYTMSHEKPHSLRSLNADLSLALTQAMRLGIPTPPGGMDDDRLQDYLVNVGTALITGEKELSVNVADRFCQATQAPAKVPESH